MGINKRIDKFSMKHKSGIDLATDIIWVVFMILIFMSSATGLTKCLSVIAFLGCLVANGCDRYIVKNPKANLKPFRIGRMIGATIAALFLVLTMILFIISAVM